MKKNNTLAVFLFSATVALVSETAFAGVPECDSLPEKEAAVARSVIDSEYMYDCCDDTIGACLKNSKTCKAAAERMARHVCRLAAKGADRAKLVRSLEKRAMSVSGPRLPALKSIQATGDSGYVAGPVTAPIVITMYTCARCPFCSKLIPAVYDEVLKGSLKGRVKLVLRPFPIKSHPNSGEANKALTASAAMGGGWAFLMEAYRHFDDFKVDAIPEMAVSAGMDRARFAEAYALGVDSTPTLFINGRRYQSELDVKTVVDVINELLESNGQSRAQSASLK